MREKKPSESRKISQVSRVGAGQSLEMIFDVQKYNRLTIGNLDAIIIWSAEKATCQHPNNCYGGIDAKN